MRKWIHGFPLLSYIGKGLHYSIQSLVLSLSPLLSWQVNMADCCGVKFSFIWKVSLLVEDIYPCNNSYSRHFKRIVNTVVTLIAMVTTVKKVNNDKTKVLDEFITCSLVSLPNSMSKLIHNRCTRKLVIKTTTAYVHANKQFHLWFCSSPLFSIVQLWNNTKAIIRLRLSEYCRIIPE